MSKAFIEDIPVEAHAEIVQRRNGREIRGHFSITDTEKAWQFNKVTDGSTAKYVGELVDRGRRYQVEMEIIISTQKDISLQSGNTTIRGTFIATGAPSRQEEIQ